MNKRWRDPDYLRWVRTLPCVITGVSGVDAHHMLGYGMHGMALKAPDWAVFPLSREEHARLHHFGWKEWEEKHGQQWYYVARTLGMAIEAGILKR